LKPSVQQRRQFAKVLRFSAINLPGFPGLNHGSLFYRLLGTLTVNGSLHHARLRGHFATHLEPHRDAE